jgi:hypothetical protein
MLLGCSKGLLDHHGHGSTIAVAANRYKLCGGLRSASRERHW